MINPASPDGRVKNQTRLMNEGTVGLTRIHVKCGRAEKKNFVSKIPANTRQNLRTPQNGSMQSFTAWQHSALKGDSPIGVKLIM